MMHQKKITLFIVCFLCLTGLYFFYEKMDDTAAVGNNEIVEKKPKLSKNQLDTVVVNAPKLDKALSEGNLGVAPREHSLVEVYKNLEVVNTPQAKFELASILSKCSRYSPVRAASFEKIYQSGDFNDLKNLEEMKEEMTRENTKCKSVFEYLPDANFNALSLAWLADSAEEGNPAAKLELLYRYPVRPSAEEVLPLIYESLELAKSEPTLRESTYFRVVSHHSDNIDSKADNGDERLVLNRDAWDYLACLNTKICDVKKFLTEYQSSFLHGYQIEAMKERASEIQKDIENSNWAALELDQAGL